MAEAAVGRRFGREPCAVAWLATLACLAGGTAVLEGQQPLEVALQEVGAPPAVQPALRALYAGEPARARAGLAEALDGGGVEPAERTRWIELLAILETADSSEVAWLGRALAALPPVSAGLPPVVDEWLAASAGTGRAPALAFLARELARAGEQAAATRLREELVRRHADSHVAPAAMLALARAALPRDSAAARRWLETLVVRFPGSAVAPVARRLLAELGGRVPTVR